MSKKKRKPNKALTYDEIEKYAINEIDVAQEYSDKRTDKRGKAWDRYYGRPLGNEVKGRSQFITRDVMDTVEWMMPYFLQMFASGDPKIDIEVKGQDPLIGKALMEKIQVDLNNAEPGMFTLFYQWFKDALVSDTSYVKVWWNLDQTTVSVEFTDLTQENAAQVEADSDIEIISTSLSDVNAALWTVNAKVKRTLKDELTVGNAPHWEFIVDPKAQSIDDDYPKGHTTEVTLDFLKRINRAKTEAKGQPFFQHLDDLGTGEHSKSATSEQPNQQRLTYTEGEELLVPPESETGARSPVKFTEWYTRLDVDGDGYLEDIVCFVGDDKLLRWEINEDGMIPFAGIKPIIDCFKFYGIAYADLLIEIQNLKTMLFRRILDQFDFQVSGRWRVDPQGQVDISALTGNIPGSVISGKDGAIEDLSPRPFQPGVMSIMEYVDSLKENRTGITRYNQGMNADSLNKTATGIMAIQSAAMQRLELVARIFAETGLKDFYRKCVILYQNHLTKPFTSKIQGVETEITPEMIQGQIICKVNMGVEASVGQQESQKLERMFMFLSRINQMFPGLIGPEQVHNIARKYGSSMGFKQITEFISDLQTYTQTYAQNQQTQQKMQQQIMKMQQQMRQMELSLKGKDIDVKARKVEQESEKTTATLQQKESESIREVEQRDLDSQRDYQLGLLQMLNGQENGAAQL